MRLGLGKVDAMDGYFALFLQMTTREDRLKILRDWMMSKPELKEKLDGRS